MELHHHRRTIGLPVEVARSLEDHKTEYLVEWIGSSAVTKTLSQFPFHREIRSATTSVVKRTSLRLLTAKIVELQHTRHEDKERGEPSVMVYPAICVSVAVPTPEGEKQRYFRVLTLITRG